MSADSDICPIISYDLWTTTDGTTYTPYTGVRVWTELPQLRFGVDSFNSGREILYLRALT